MSGFVSRLERLDVVDSTQRVVRERLDAGEPEVLVAVADVQTAGRGRLGRSWDAPPGAALLASAGFRPRDLAARLGWRLGAVVALAMVDAAEEMAGLRDGTLALKWPNDIVADGPGGSLRKVGGVLGEVVLEGDRIASACVGIGVDVDWVAADFPPHLAAVMSSLREVAGGRPVDRGSLLEAWLDRLEPRYEALRGGRFDTGGWSARQRTTGRRVEVEPGALGQGRPLAATTDGEGRPVAGIAEGVDPESGALLVRDESTGALVVVGSGEVVRCRIIEGPARG